MWHGVDTRDESWNFRVILWTEKVIGYSQNEIISDEKDVGAWCAADDVCFRWGIQNRVFSPAVLSIELSE